jgi:hypothetical protein
MLRRGKQTLLSALRANGLLWIQRRRNHFFMSAFQPFRNSVINWRLLFAISLRPHFGPDVISALS